MPNQPKVEPGQTDLIRWGWIITGTWAAVVLVAVIWLLWPCWSDSCERLTLPAFGDFLAGIFAPLAFFWFVIAVFLQRDELHQNSTALRLQTEELKALVKGAREAAAHNERLEMNRHRELQPNLVFTLRDRSAGRERWDALNTGGDALNVTYQGRPNDAALSLSFDQQGGLIRRGEKLKIGFVASCFPSVDIRYTDTDGRRWQQRYSVNLERTAWRRDSEEAAPEAPLREEGE